MYRESLPLFVSRVGLWLTAESTLLIGGYFLGSERIADFALVRQIAAIGAGLTAAIPNAVSPHTAAAFASGDQEKVRTMFFATVRYGLIVNVLWTVGLLLWADRVITLLVGPGHFLGQAVLVPVAVGGFLELLAALHGSLAWNIGRWPFTRHIVAGGVLNVALASLGAATFGFSGLAWGQFVSQVTTVQWFQVAYVFLACGMPFGAYVRDMLRPTVAYATAVAIAAVGVRAIADGLRPFAFDASTAARVATTAWLLASVCVTAAVAGLAAWGLALTPQDRSYFAGMLRRGR